jgi:hypothetical protein
MHIIYRWLLGFMLLTTLNGVAIAQPPTELVGSWRCESDGTVSFLVTFNLGGVFTASGNQLYTSVNHGAWQRTGLRTFSSTDLAFIYDPDGNAEYIQVTDAITTMSDNNNLTADFEITIRDLAGNVVETATASAVCNRIEVNF